MDRVNIRAASPGDGEACARLWQQFGEALVERMPGMFRVPGSLRLTDWFEAQIASTTEDVLRIVAELDDEVVGLANAVLRRPDPANASLIADHLAARVILEDVVVADHLRSRGIGELLVRAVEDWGRAHGAASITLHSDPDGPPRRFYERLGYRIQGAVYGRPL